MTRRRPALALLAAMPLLAAGLAACQMPGTEPERRTVIFFTEDSASLDDRAVAEIRGAAADAKARPNARITVLGFAGPAGDARYNQALSDARARHVVDHLVEDGVARTRIQVRPRGPVPFEMMPTESRRVEIVVGG